MFIGSSSCFDTGLPPSILHYHSEPYEFISKMSTQTARVPKLLDDAEKFNSLSRAHQRCRRQTEITFS